MLLKAAMRVVPSPRPTVPGNSPADVFPHTLHARHRPYSDATELELSVTFREDPHRHRVRYSEGDDSGGGSRVGGGGVVRYDGLMEVRYEFTTHQGSIAFQGDVRDRDLAAYFDVDVVWSDRQSRTDSYGNVRGIATIQRIKIWRDRSSGPFYGPSSYSLSVFANRQERRNREYRVEHFEPDPRADDRHRTVRLNVRGRRQSESETSSGGGSGGSSGRRPSLIRRLRESSSHHAHGHGHSRSSGSGSSSRSATQQPSGWPDVRYLSIQFSSDYGK